MKTRLLFAFSLLLSVSTFGQLNMTYQGNITYDEELSDIWGYVAPDSTEYALVGVYNGVSIVDVSDPENPTELFFLDGVNSGWRDIKTWGEHAYVSNETSNGLMVIDLSELPDTATSYDWTPFIEGVGTLSSIHNLWIDEFGYAYLCGSNLNSGGLLYVDVHSDPGNPEYVGKGAAVYSHDVYVRDNKAYSSEIYTGAFAIYNVDDKDSSYFLGSQTTYYNFAHNGWLSDDGTIFYTTDELANATVGAYDVSDPEDIIELDQYRPYETLGDGVIPHNVHVWDDWLIISYYTDGCIIVDGSNPDNLVEVGNFDTYIPASTGFSGAWGAYPYLPSGTVLVSDIGNGMYTLEPNYVRACWLEGNITRSDDSTPINDASIVIETTNVDDYSDVFGDYTTGYATAGDYTITVSKPGFETAVIEAVTLQNDSTTILDVELTPLPSFAFSGEVVDAESGEGIPTAKVMIVNDGFTYEMQTVANGTFAIDEFFEGSYDVYAGKWGYMNYVGSEEDFTETNNTILIELEEGYEDIFSLDLGWTASSDAQSGDWERGEPIGVTPDGVPILISPDEDVEEDEGNHCYVTGNTASVNSGVVIGGDVTLSSPVFDIEDYEEPYLSFHYSYFNLYINGGNNPGPNNLVLMISNGIEEVEVEGFSYDELEGVEWLYYELDIASVIDVTSTMSISIICESSPNFNTASEGAVDYFQVWDQALVSVSELDDKLSAELLVSPNPSNFQFNLDYTIHSGLQNAYLSVINTMGQEVDRIPVNGLRGRIQFGQDYRDGLYFIQLINGGQQSESIKIIKQ